MGNLTEHVMINKWDDDIRSAIQSVGGDVKNAPGLPDYADVIKTQLISNTAEENGIYQDFLYVDEHEQTHIYPWEGEPTKSKHAPQSNIVAESIKALYNAMDSTERFNVLLVDEIPSKEINLSAIYLLKAESEYTYTGCYFAKSGKEIKRIDIPEFKINLSDLFFLTREEYKSGFDGYVEEIESLLKKIFGKYWSDEGFYLEDVIDDVVKDLTDQLKLESDKILQEVNNKLQTIDENLNEMNNEINSIKSNLNSELNTLSNKIDSVESEMNDKLVQVGSDVTEMRTKIDSVESEMNDKLVQVGSEMTEIRTKIDSVESEMNDKLVQVGSEMIEIRTKIDSVESDVNDRLVQVGSEMTEMRTKIDSVESDVNDNIETFKNNINTELSIIGGRVDSIESDKETIQNDIINLNIDLQQYKEEGDLKFLNKILDRIDLEEVNKLK